MGRLGTFDETLAMTETVPLLDPGVAGVKFTPILVLPPAGSVRGRFCAAKLKPFPAATMRVTVIGAFPGLDSVADWVWVWPIGTFPKLMLVGFSLSPPPMIAVPRSAKVVDNRIWLLARTTFPWEVPPLCGE